ncbi:MAG: PQQ-dependent sugar dehydrogenase [Chloroflexi bacterium]|nr:PQQ-dependent sugar dehydrogenase [Chloroflexota bacterium]
MRFEPALGGRTFDRPVEAGAYPAGPDRSAMFVTEQSGLVLVFHEGRESTLIDLRAQVSRSGNEEGLLSVELDPAFTSNGHVWLYYSVAGGQRRTRLSRVTVDLARAPYRADPASELVVLEVPQPFSNHNGGAIRFGPDRMLYLGLGDGGSGGDPQRHGQNLGTLLGSVIRIDVLAATPDRPYTVPADNPFVGRAGARPEIWAWGLRNPWRMSFDPATGVLWLGDVGQNASEEVNVIERGGNYGWNVLEGFACFLTPGSCDRSGKIHPVVVYTQGFGKRECSITGGVVYRGSAVPALRGHYLYGDFCSGALWALDVESRGEPAQLATGVGSIASFARDAAGEVYVLAFGKPLLRIVAR